MNAHQFATTLTSGMTAVTLITTAGYCWRGFVRLARRVGN